MNNRIFVILEKSKQYLCQKNKRTIAENLVFSCAFLNKNSVHLRLSKKKTLIIPNLY